MSSYTVISDCILFIFLILTPSGNILLHPDAWYKDGIVCHHGRVFRWIYHRLQLDSSGISSSE